MPISLSRIVPLIIFLFNGAIASASGELIWSDEFDSGTSLDHKIWSYDLGASGWGQSWA